MQSSTGSIAAKLPYVRRYAHALTGSRAMGDEYVRTCLEVIVRDRHRMAEDIDPQTALFRLFHKVHASAESAPAADPRAPMAGCDPALRTVMALPPLERQVLLLSALERYSFADVAYILDVPEATVRDLFNRAQESMANWATAKVVIADRRSEAPEILQCFGEDAIPG